MTDSVIGMVSLVKSPSSFDASFAEVDLVDPGLPESICRSDLPSARFNVVSREWDRVDRSLTCGTPTSLAWNLDVRSP
ncbi:MAG: hypothetical protein JNK85_11505 [Verrucomicrobiales bacterium]|nr:hypothetical protein [Verrucomicrobiales bacterium]